MTESVSESVAEIGRPLSDFWRPLVDRWQIILIIPATLVLVVLMVQATKQPKFTARTAVAPTREAISGLESQIGGLSKLAAVAGVNVGAGPVPVSDFDRFRFLMFSVRLGEIQAKQQETLLQIFGKQWNPELKTWQRPTTPVQEIKNLVFPVFGLTPWAPPDGRSIAKHYDEFLSVSEIGETGIYQIRLEDTDPERAMALLRKVVQDGNELAREDAALRAKSRAEYLRLQLATAQIAEYRANLATMLAKEEQTLMLASTSLPFAAETVEPVNIARNPSSQRPLLFSAIAGAIGLSIAVFVALLLGPKTRRETKIL